MNVDDNNSEEIVLEPEEENSEGTPSQKLKKMREALAQSRREVQENLTGWQRTKADYVNLQKRMRDAEEAGIDAGVIKMARSISVVFDSLEAALKASHDSPESVQKGMSQVETQLESALKEHGVERYTPKVGDLFDPEKHEPMQTLETSDEKLDNTIADVFQSGYIKDKTVVRPARVSVNKLIH